MMKKQLCSYCNSLLKGTIVHIKRVPPLGSTDVGIVDEGIEVMCPSCKKAWGPYNYRVESKKKYIFFGPRRTYVQVFGCNPTRLFMREGGAYELSKMISSTLQRYEKEFRGEIIDKGCTTFDVYMRTYHPSA